MSGTKRARFLGYWKAQEQPVPTPRFSVRPVHPRLTLQHVREIRRRFLTPPRPTIAMLAHDYEPTVAVIRDILLRRSHYDLEDDLVPSWPWTSRAGHDPPSFMGKDHTRANRWGFRPRPVIWARPGRGAPEAVAILP